MASVFVLLEAFNRKEAAALGFFPCATASFFLLLALLIAFCERSEHRKPPLLGEVAARLRAGRKGPDGPPAASRPPR